MASRRRGRFRRARARVRRFGGRIRRGISKGRTIPIGRIAGVAVSGATTVRNLMVGPGGDPVAKLMGGNLPGFLDSIVLNGQANFQPAQIVATILPAVTMGIAGKVLDMTKMNPTAKVGKWSIKAI